MLFEKLPLFGLAVASCVVTIFVQQEALQSFDKFPLSLRAGNALISYMAYLGQMFRPSGLAVLYPLSAGDLYLTVSMGEPFNSFCYKLVAALIPLLRDER